MWRKGLNRDIEKRDELIFGSYDKDQYIGGIRNFKGLTLIKLNQLIDEGFVILDDAQNEAPTIRELKEFSEKYNGRYTFDGYVVCLEKPDYRLSIDAIRCVDKIEDEKEIEDFNKLTEFAEAAYLDKGYAWWD